MGRPSAREEIVQAGLKCLVEKGFNAVGVQDITDTAGVPKGSFYNHFESKEALGVEIVERYGANQTRREILTDPSVPPLRGCGVISIGSVRCSRSRILSGIVSSAA